MRWQILPLVVLPLSLLWSPDASAQSAPAADAATPPTQPATPPALPPESAPAPPAASTKLLGVELLSLRVMHEKNMLSDAEYESALRDLNDTSGAQASESMSIVAGKWATTLYGFVEADSIFDTTQSLGDLAGNSQIARSSTYAGYHSRMQFGARNSRVGLRMKAPEVSGIRVSGVVETDFLGNQSLGYATGQANENQYFTSPLLRIRHMYVKAETGVVDLLLGQTWDLFGWQSAYHPNTVEIQGVPGQIYSRTPQIRLSKTLKTAPVTVEIAAAAMRPPQRDSAWPEGQGGIRIAINGWTGVQTAGAAATSIQPASIAFTGDVRHIDVPDLVAAPTGDVGKTATAGAIDAFLPVLPASKGKMGNALSLNGEFASGYGTADLYTGLTGGVTFPALPNPTGANPAPAWPQDIDNGIATYTAGGQLNFIQWTSYLIGAQYYLPGLDGRLWVSGNFSHMESSNTPKLYASSTKVRGAEDWWDVNLFGDVTPALRLGLEYAQFIDHYVDGNSPTNQRVQLSGFFIF
jgi:hypothetical protein